MALHRDIFWIGRQWAVTGFGMQAINQKHNGQFDIAIERLWDDDLPNALRGEKWFNPDDFAKGLAVAQARHPKPPSRPAPSPLPVQTLLHAGGTTAPAEAAVPDTAAVETAVPEPLKAAEATPSLLQMGPSGHSAKLLRVWRVRRRH
jgi:hypothetical protein